MTVLHSIRQINQWLTRLAVHTDDMTTDHLPPAVARYASRALAGIADADYAMGRAVDEQARHKNSMDAIRAESAEERWRGHDLDAKMEAHDQHWGQ